MRRAYVILIALALLVLSLLLFPEAAGANLMPAMLSDPFATPGEPLRVFFPAMSGAFSPTPTATVAPTANPTTTPTTTPTPTGQPTGVVVLDNHTAFVSSIGSLHIMGEVGNFTQANVRLVKVLADVLDSGGAKLDDDWTYPPAKVIVPGDRACFNMILSPAPNGWASYAFGPPTYHSDGVPLTGLTVSDLNGEYVSQYRWYELKGHIRNTSASRVEYVQPVGTLYDVDGVVVGCFFTYVEGTHLDPGATAAFSITYSGRDYANVRSYRVQVNGTPK